MEKPVDLDDAYKAIAKVIRQRNEAREETERLRADLASAEGALRQADSELIMLAEENEKLRAEVERLRGALEKARGPIAKAASYADSPGVSLRLQIHGCACARILPEINAALREVDPKEDQ